MNNLLTPEFWIFAIGSFAGAFAGLIGMLVMAIMMRRQHHKEIRAFKKHVAGELNKALYCLFLDERKNSAYRLAMEGKLNGKYQGWLDWKALNGLLTQVVNLIMVDCETILYSNAYHWEKFSNTLTEKLTIKVYTPDYTGEVHLPEEMGMVAKYADELITFFKTTSSVSDGKVLEFHLIQDKQVRGGHTTLAGYLAEINYQHNYEVQANAELGEVAATIAKSQKYSIVVIGQADVKWLEKRVEYLGMRPVVSVGAGTPGDYLTLFLQDNRRNTVIITNAEDLTLEEMEIIVRARKGNTYNTSPRVHYVFSSHKAWKDSIEKHEVIALDIFGPVCNYWI